MNTNDWLNNPTRANYVIDYQDTIDVNVPYNSPNQNNLPRTALEVASPGVIDETLNRSGSDAFGSRIFQPSAVDGSSGLADVNSIDKQTAEMKASDQRDRNYKAGLAGAKMFVDIMNAQNAYWSETAVNNMNLLTTRNAINDARARGSQRALYAREEGRNMADDAALAMAIQGQDVRGAGVQNITASYETVGIINGMNEEINGLREALGLEIQQAELEYANDRSRLNRDTRVFNALLEGAAGAYGRL